MQQKGKSGKDLTQLCWGWGGRGGCHMKNLRKEAGNLQADWHLANS